MLYEKVFYHLVHGGDASGNGSSFFRLHVLYLSTGRAQLSERQIVLNF